MQPIQPAQPGQPLRASDINAQTEELRRQGNMSFDSGTISNEAGSVHLSVNPANSFFARITKRNTYFNPYRYAWKEVTRRKNDWVLTPNGRYSDGVTDYAVEFNGNFSVPNNAVVELQPIYDFVDGNRISHVYGFRYHFLMPSSLENFVEVVTSVQCTADGISCSTVALCGSQYDNVYLRQFLQLTDVTPKSYLGNAGRAVVVNSAGTALEFGAVINHMAGSFIALADTPQSYGAAYSTVVVNSSSTGIEFRSNLVTTTGSIKGGGNPSSTSWSTLVLDGDANSPGANKYYGTNSAGTKGFYSLTTSDLTNLQSTVTTLQNALSALAVRVSALGG
jgi:hypothetical protein